MASSNFFVVLTVVAAIHLSNGDSLDENCDDQYMCIDKPDNYDAYQNHIDTIVEKNMDIISKGYDRLDDFDGPITTGDDENCKAVTTVETPFIIKTNTSSEYVVQSEVFQQKILVTRCKRAQSSCFHSMRSFDSAEATCEEKLGAVSLYIYDPETKEILFKMFEVPVCCQCRLHIKY